jgi:hypothetical protein
MLERILKFARRVFRRKGPAIMHDTGPIFRPIFKKGNRGAETPDTLNIG